MSRLHLPAAIVLLILLSAGVGAQSMSSVVAGRVLDQNGDAVVGALVTLDPDSIGTARRVESGADGSFRFGGIPAGEHTLRVSAPGFSAAERTLTVSVGAAVSSDFTLRTSSLSADVTVTATRTIESVAAVPGAVTVLDREQVRDQADLSNSVSDALGKLVPGLSPGSQSLSTFGQTLRGRNALVLIDGVPQSTNRNVSRDLTTIDPSAIERVEVIRGATSVYGEGATGGIINIITRRPAEGRLDLTTDFGFNASLSHPSDSLGGWVRQTASSKLGRFDFLVSGSFDRAGGVFDADGDRIPPDPHGQGGPADTDAVNLFGKFGLDLTRSQRLQFTVNRFASEQETGYASDPTVNSLPALSQKARAIPGLQLDEPQDTTNNVFNLDYSNGDLFGSRLQAQVYRREYLTRFFPFDGRAFPVFGRTIYQSRLDSKKSGGRLAVETPVQRRTGLTVVYGLDYANEHTAQHASLKDPAAFDQSGGLIFRTVGDRAFVPLIQQRNTGAFAQVEWKKLERAVLRGGLRHERIRVRIDDFTTIAGAPITGGDLSYTDTLFNLGGVVYATDQISLFANFAQGFSAPDIGLTLRGAPRGASINTLPFAAQKVDTYETGVRGFWAKAQGSLSLFYNRSDLGTSSGGFNQPVVRAPERVYGMEATLDVQPASRLRAGSSLTWLEGKSDPNLDGVYTYLNSYRIPPVKLTAYVEHDTTARWRNRLQLLYSGERARFGRSVAFGERAVEDYATLDYLGSVRLPKGRLRFGVENLLNRQYFVRESQLLRTGGNASYAAAQGATVTVGYSIDY
jgi:iron complex outermembrane recepter protein